MRMRKSSKGVLYGVLLLGDKVLTDDLGDCLVVSCTNRRRLSEITGISYDRLTYVFVRKGRSCLVEGGCIILKSGLLYKGNQVGGWRGGDRFGSSRNK